MPKTLDVEKQRFTFDDEWKIALKYDDTACYREGIERLKGEIDKVPQSTRAVDVLALHTTAGLLMMEVKDFRGHRIANKHRITNKEVILEAALKIRDTVAGLVGAAREVSGEFNTAAISAAYGPGKELLVVLWLEDDASEDPRKWKAQLDVLTQELKTKVRWLHAKCFVVSGSLHRLPGLSVTNLPGAGQS